jgi:hypothetical protein
MNTKSLLVWSAFTLCSVAAAPSVAQQRDVHITMEVLDDVSDIDAVILALEDERPVNDLERGSRDAGDAARREDADSTERTERTERRAQGSDARAERGARGDDERVDEREDSIEDRNLERDVEIELDPELDVREDEAAGARR